ncbi:flagellar biosynthetic protein FliO [Trinickia caryophylli]|uniref:Flagellar protein n=1 Tax=Trinickia caryophylli TaxID=28094 RepID=A0A1X7FIB7_TRICW|nr:flagellar biosynthetic protein FliO [Trinickia caryophylli]TRX19213.1 flagellar biosynthetic protein FliO [Trinickia caryophylli]GLU33984.1 flagellar protein [Trinickia caryophylli]SMF51974.1 flagellar protein FliO/FliZ [Trinickia caryophylli]
MKSIPRRLPAVIPPFPAAVAMGLALVAEPLDTFAADLNAINNAARTASGVAAGTAVPSLGIGAVLQTVLGLAIVIGLVFACAWLARRFGLQPSSRGNVVRTIGGVSLGGKERVAVVEIGDTWLVLGAAPGNVRLLHTLPAGAVDALNAARAHSGDAPDGEGPGGPDAASRQTSFGSRFRAALGDEAKKRFSRPSGGGK